MTTALALPLVGALVVAFMPKTGDLAKKVALGFSLLTLVVVAAVGLGFDPSGDRYQFVEDHVWIRAVGAHYAVGVDGIGLALVLMTAVLAPVVLLASWNDGEKGRWSANAFFALMLTVEGLAIAVFSAMDVFLFYVLFEAILIPIYFLIGGFGGERRTHAAVKFLIFSLLGGLILLAAVVGLYAESAKAGNPSYLLTDLTALDLGGTTGRLLFLGFFIAFAIKSPMVPVHSWLPDAADEATPGTSVLLISVLDKIGTFGMIRFCLGLFPEASHWATPVVLVLAVLSIVYGALLAVGTDSIPRLVAWTSVSHMGFIVLGVFVLNTPGQSGSTLYMVNHGISTAALFLVTGFLISRRGSKFVSDFGGAEKVAPVAAGLFLVAGLATLSLPGLSPFVSEFLVLVGAFVYGWGWAVVAVSGIVLAALYILLMYQRTMTGPTRPELATMKDLNLREVVAMAPLVLLLVLLGFFPKPLTAIINPAVAHVMSDAGTHDPEPAVPAAGAAEESHQ
jgi:NADH-quinone oxidoreductase subunit M